MSQIATSGAHTAAIVEPDLFKELREDIKTGAEHLKEGGLRSAGTVKAISTLRIEAAPATPDS